MSNFRKQWAARSRTTSTRSARSGSPRPTGRSVVRVPVAAPEEDPEHPRSSGPALERLGLREHPALGRDSSWIEPAAPARSARSVRCSPRSTCSRTSTFASRASSRSHSRQPAAELGQPDPARQPHRDQLQGRRGRPDPGAGSRQHQPHAAGHSTCRTAAKERGTVRGRRPRAGSAPLDFTILASKQEGRSERASYAGGSSRQNLPIKDLDYIRDTYFFLYDPNERTASPMSSRTEHPRLSRPEQQRRRFETPRERARVPRSGSARQHPGAR